MTPMLKRLACFSLLLLVALSGAQQVDHDVIYAKSGGAAFTMDVYKPAAPNGVGVIWLISGGWFSNHQMLSPGYAKPFTDKGATVFEVVHGSQPRYTIPEILLQIKRAVRMVHVLAPKYGVDPHRIDISGGSAGGHLSLMIGATGDDGNPAAADPVDQASSKVDAVAVFFPPTDFLNWGSPGSLPISDPKLAIFIPAFGINKDTPLDKAKTIAHDVSPIYYVTKSMPPTLIIHGDSDQLVPLQQSQLMDAKLTELGIDHQLIVVPKGDHGASTATPANYQKLVDWVMAKLGKP